MNRERMLKLAEVIEGGILRVDFDMGDYDARPGNVRSGDPIPNCGTACCIAGHACLVFGERTDPINGDAAKHALGLTFDQASRLFLNDNDYISAGYLSDITRKDAARAIRRMVAEEGSA